jgi:hypothetical protein
VELIEVSPGEYQEYFPKPFHAFNSVEFSLLNKNKVDSVHFLIFKDTKLRAGLILGKNNQLSKAPFSAPYGGFTFAYEDVKLSQIEQIIDCLDTWLVTQNMRESIIVLPPIFYDENYVTKITNVLLRKGYILHYQDINYQFELHKIQQNYEQIIWRNARKNLRKSLESALTFEKLPYERGEEAYQIIQQSRLQRNIPLRMTWEQVNQTGELLNADFFSVNKNGQAIAAAIVFKVSDTIVQVIYWGDLPDFSENKTMNFLSYHVFQFYNSLGYTFVDIGPSTEFSIPNTGLCEFKESIGCDLSLKFTFRKTFHS